MSKKEQTPDPQQNLAELAARFYRKAEEAASGPQAGAVKSVFKSLHELFTKDVTRQGLSDLFSRDPQDAFRFFTRGIDFTALKPLPWYRRYPEIAARVFIALAYRLSPARRIAFAVATFTFLIGFIPVVNLRSEAEGGTVLVFSGGLSNIYWLLSICIFGMLLLMELRDKVTLKADLEIARQIQFGLVPLGLFERDGWRIFSEMRPANTVGGDYIDIIELDPPHQIALVVADVAGKGMPAALLMALLQASLRTLVTAGHRGPDLIAKLNDYLSASIPDNSLITMFYVEVDIRTGLLRYVNAGHNHPILLRAGSEVERLQTTSLVLGAFGDTPFESRESCLGPGDHLLVFTDGLTEAANARDEEYGEERLVSLFKSRAASDQTELMQALIEDVLAFCSGNRPHDDITLMSVTRH
jgi:phosphoserine phosphatase RsbU/P